MGKQRRSVKDASSIEHDPQHMAGWQPEPAREYVVNDEDAELDEVFSDFPQNEACIELFRVNAQGGRPLFLEQIAPVTFSFAYVTERYGGGKYIAKGKYKDGSKKRMPFEIEGEPFPVKRKLPDAGPVAATVSAAPVQPMVETIQIPSGSDFQTALLTMMRQLVSESRNSEMQVLEKMRIYKELFSAPAQKDAPLDVALNMFSKGVELAGMQSGGDGPNFWMMALKELKEPLSKIVDTVQFAVANSNRQPVNVNPSPAAAPGAPARPAVSAPPVAPSNEEPMLMFVKMVMPSLINGAAKNSEPELYVDFLLDQIPQSGYAPLKTWLEAPEWFDRLATIEPGIRFQAEWWGNLREQLLGALSEGEPDADRSIQSQPDKFPTTGGSADSSSLS